MNNIWRQRYELGDALRWWREHLLEKSQRELARQCGMNHVYISRVETGRTPSTTTMLRVAQAYQVPLPVLFALADVGEPKMPRAEFVKLRQKLLAGEAPM